MKVTIKDRRVIGLPEEKIGPVLQWADHQAEWIGAEAFAGQSKLEEVVLGEGIRVIETKAFYRCENLKKLVLPESLEEIGDSAFLGCGSSCRLPFGGRKSILLVRRPKKSNVLRRRRKAADWGKCFFLLFCAGESGNCRRLCPGGPQRLFGMQRVRRSMFARKLMRDRQPSI